jgi:hypothetical protein
MIFSKQSFNQKREKNKMAHSSVGTTVTYRVQGKEITGEVTGTRPGNPIINMTTGVENKNTFQFHIKPADGSDSFWTMSLAEI